MEKYSERFGLWKHMIWVCDKHKMKSGRYGSDEEEKTEHNTYKVER